MAEEGASVEQRIEAIDVQECAVVSSATLQRVASSILPGQKVILSWMQAEPLDNSPFQATRFLERIQVLDLALQVASKRLTKMNPTIPYTLRGKPSTASFNPAAAAATEMFWKTTFCSGLKLL